MYLPSKAKTAPFSGANTGIKQPKQPRGAPPPASLTMPPKPSRVIARAVTSPAAARTRAPGAPAWPVSTGRAQSTSTPPPEPSKPSKPSTPPFLSEPPSLSPAEIATLRAESAKKWRRVIWTLAFAAVTFTGAIYGAGLKTQQEWKAVSEDYSLSSYLTQLAKFHSHSHFISFSFHPLGRIKSYHTPQHDLTGTNL